MHYWLMKSEPSVYSMQDLVRDGRTAWEGVRNYQARNFIREMQVGDLVLFHHSSADPPAVAGVARVSRAPYPDPDPTWTLVDIEPVEAFAAPVPLAELKADPKLEGMLLLAKGQRLSVQPVTKAHFDRVVALAKQKGKKAKKG